ncbi:hypothetical protein TanjilG_22902 [Lupinus angustifolius]|uniref:Transmembrane protein n=1 Tax=Lupinus angustifolius TaxID=3871 RepID=A0A1J7HE23_LUPAN|nr:hypothetical protein TanjilG_22902 [Lupinus angustifolius]
MALDKNFLIVVVYALILLLLCHDVPSAIVHDHDSTPKKPGCENQFVLVKVKTWVNGIEDAEFVGVGA